MKGFVYAIVCGLTQREYIGSTFQSITERYLWHQSVMNKCSSKQIISEHSSVKLLQEAEVENKEQLRALEQIHFDKSANKVNKNRPIRTESQRKQQLVDYRFNNKEYYKTYRYKAAWKWAEPFVCDCGGRFTRINKNAHLKREKHCVFLAQTTPVISISNITMRFSVYGSQQPL